MRAWTRIAGFAALLAVVFAVAAIAGAEVDPSVDNGSIHEDGNEAGEPAASEHDGGSVAEALPGLAVESGDHRLMPEETTLPAGPRTSFRFRIVEAGGETVRDYDLEHERRMHLILVRRDFENFQHLHPRQLEDGTWVARADTREGGVYRAFADFATEGESLTLGTDLFVPGRFDPAHLPHPAKTADAGNGYEVSLESTPRSGGTSPATFTVSRNGREVGSVQPYLGADGHLVALREHDQAFLHTHPEGEPGGPGPIAFQVEYPTPGRYRLFLQFKHRGEVRTAAFTQEVAGSGAHTGEEEGDDGH